MQDIYHVAKIASRIPLNDDYVKEAADVWDVVIPGAGLGMTALILSQLLGFDKKTSALLTVLGAVAGAGLGASGLASILGGKAGEGEEKGEGAIGDTVGTLSPTIAKEIEQALRALDKGEGGYTTTGKAVIGVPTVAGAGIGAFPELAGKLKDLPAVKGLPELAKRAPEVAKEYANRVVELAKRSPEIAKEYASRVVELAKHSPEIAKYYGKNLVELAKRAPEVAKDYGKNLVELAKRAPEVAKEYANRVVELAKRSPEVAKEYASRAIALAKRSPEIAKGLYGAGVQRAGGALASLKGVTQSVAMHKKDILRRGGRGAVGGFAGYGLGTILADALNLRRED